MISDNTVHGDSIYLRELQNFFFEVLGMTSITHYGARGDGITDNYAYLQVAIDDAHRRGLNYLYVPYGRFIYTGELINIGNLTFIGNPHAHIVNIRTGEEINIEQFGVGGSGTTVDVKKISENIVLTNSSVGLTTGLYNTDQYGIYLNTETPENEAIGSDEIFYYDAVENVIISALKKLFYQGGAWVPYSINIDAAVPLEVDVVLTNDGLPELDAGLYYTAGHKVYLGSESTSNILFGENEIFYFDAVNSSLSNTVLKATYGSGEWHITGKPIEVASLDQDIILIAGATVNMQTGTYRFLDSAGLYYHTVSEATLLHGANDGKFYFDSTEQAFYLNDVVYFYDNDAADWLIVEHSNITNEVLNDRRKMPTSQAVFNAIAEIPAGGFVNIITCALESDYTLSGSSDVSLPLTKRTKIGAKFTVNSNGEVVIGHGVSFIKVCGMLTVEDFNSIAPIDCYIAKNGQRYGEAYIYDTSVGANDTYVSVAIPEFVLPVVEGDAIQLRVAGNTGVKFTGGDGYMLYNYMTVEAAGYTGTQYINFTSPCHPSSWTLDTDTNKDCAATNTYGEWAVHCQYAGAAHQLIDKMWKDALSSSVFYSVGNTNTFEVIMECPTDISIKPSKINYMWYAHSNTATLTIFGMEEGSNAWTQLKVINEPDSAVTEYTASISTNKYFTKFKITRQITGAPTDSTSVRMNIGEGTLKDARG